MKPFRFWLLPIIALAALSGAAQLHPNNGRGFDPQKAYQLGDVDHVNLFSGNLVVTLPIGQAFPVSDHLQYQLRLVYNGNPWDYRTDGFDPEAYPSRFMNAGIGWQLTLGDLVAPNDAGSHKLNKNGGWVYATPDGAEHVFYRALHKEEVGSAYEAAQTPGNDDVVGYTRDGSYLRLVRRGLTLIFSGQEPGPVDPGDDPVIVDIYVAEYAVEFPDGTVHTFTSEQFVTTTGTTPDAAFERSAHYSLTKMEDRFGNNVTVSDVSTAAGATRTIADSVGRSHTIHYVNNDVYQFRGNPVRSGLITSVVLEAAHDEAVEYTFTYGAYETMTTPCAGTVPRNTLTTRARFLKTLTARKAAPFGEPANAALLTYEMDNFTTEPDVDCWVAGHLSSLTLPTGGTITYTAGYRLFPDGVGWNPDDHTPPFQYSAAVGSRTVTGTNGVAAVWKYKSHLRNLGYAYDAERRITQSSNRELAVVVTDPLKRSTAHYFNVYTGIGEEGDCFSGADRAEYGLPFTRTSNTGAGDLYLSSEVFPAECVTFGQDLATCPTLTACKDLNGVTVAPVRRTYVAYEYDTKATISSYPLQHLNQRLTASRTTYRDDTSCTGGCHVEQRFDDQTFDGLGHYRTESRSGNFAGASSRQTTTHYNANVNAGNYSAGATPANYMIGKDDPWLLSLHDEVKIAEDGSEAVRKLCFDASTGFLKRSRALTASSAATTDLLTVFTHTAGNVTGEGRHGGDDVPLSAGFDTCNGSPGAATYSLTHAYTAGTRSSTQYAGTTFKSLDLTVDTNTALPTASRDTAGVATTLVHDVLGRLTKAQPEDEAPTEYLYDLASRPASVTVKTTDPSTEAVLLEQRHYYDGLGRLIQTREKMPDGWATTKNTYDLLGRVVTTSMPEYRSSGDYEAAFTPQFVTTFAYDQFGRTTSVTTADGKSATTEYTGVRVADRKVDVGGNNVTTREEYDGHGRLVKVTEDYGGAGIATSYGYDVGNRLTRVETAGVLTQVRTFSYDGRGLLTGESHPEKGAAGYGHTSYSKYDAGGNLRSRTDGSSTGMYDLAMTYDSAGRLLTVQDRDPATAQRRTLKEYTYATENACTNGQCDERRGKLWKATRHNYLPNLGDVKVEETYTYTGLGGRPKKRETVVTGTAAFTGASFVLEQSWTSLGHLDSITYPSTAAVSQPRIVSYGYTDGQLTSVSGYASSITYHPNRLPAVVTHANGVAESWVLDRRMARPLRIVASGPNMADWQYGNYSYDGAGNITGTGGTTFTATYRYDAFSRLIGWTQTEGAAHVTVGRTYDDYGNYRTGTLRGCTAPLPGQPTGNCYTTSFQPLNPDSSTNHYPSETYDAAGNVTADAAHDYGYDGSGMMTLLMGAGRNLRYIYTADDERIAIVDGVAATTTWTLRGTDNRLLRTFTRTNLTGTSGWNWTEDEIWRGSQLLASESPSGRKHYHLDHLGSPRLITASNGTRIGEQRFTPFGRGGSADGGRIQFTGHEADRNGNQQGLIYAHARYLDVDRGRFLSVDPGRSWEPRRPQSWNRYAYASNNPINRIDPDGLKDFTVVVGAQQVLDPTQVRGGNVWTRTLAQGPGRNTVSRPFNFRLQMTNGDYKSNNLLVVRGDVTNGVITLRNDAFRGSQAAIGATKPLGSIMSVGGTTTSSTGPSASVVSTNENGQATAVSVTQSIAGHGQPVLESIAGLGDLRIGTSINLMLTGQGDQVNASATVTYSTFPTTYVCMPLSQCSEHPAASLDTVKK